MVRIRNGKVVTIKDAGKVGAQEGEEGAHIEEFQVLLVALQELSGVLVEFNKSYKAIYSYI